MESCTHSFSHTAEEDRQVRKFKQIFIAAEVGEVQKSSIGESRADGIADIVIVVM